MRKAILILLASLSALLLAAKPAKRQVGTVLQSDGSRISVILHGNGDFHYATDASGRLLETDALGFYRLSAARKVQEPSTRRFKSPAIGTLGEVHIPVIPVEFANVSFSFEDIGQMIYALLNQPGYSFDGASGSVRDYWYENSGGRFTPVFDVLPVVTLEKNISEYGRNVQNRDRAPELALYEACLMLDDDTDFSVYDRDQDGILDMVIYIYAGYDEAEHGPADAIWSRQDNAQESSNKTVQNAMFDGKKLGRYICTSELSGNSGEVFTSIGTTCHEFAHALGLPDFYDTNQALDGLAGGMYSFSLMGMGLYNNSGKTPPYLTALEKKMLGWLDDIPLLPEGTVSFAPVQLGGAYMSPSGTEGEYFIWEARNGSGWDAPLPKGLLVYHIDASERIVGELPASSLWEDWMTYNNLNALAEHPCAYLIPSSDHASKNYVGDISGIPFPGVSNCVFMDVTDWEGNETEYQVADISSGESGVSAFVYKGHGPVIAGKVCGIDGQPVQGVIVGADIAEIVAATDRDGRFILDLPEGSRDLPYRLTAFREGYRKAAEDGVLEGRSTYHPVTVMKMGESTPVVLRKYDPSVTEQFFTLPSDNYGDCMGAVRWTSEELFPYVGRRLEEVVFDNYVLGGEAEAVYVIVDIGTERVLTAQVENPALGRLETNVVDLSSYDIRIPDGADIYVGYGIKGASYKYPLAACERGHKDGSWFGKLDLNSSAWERMQSVKSTNGYMDLILSASVAEVPEYEDMGRMGYATIDAVSGGWMEGDTFELKLKKGSADPLSIEWLFDGSVINDGRVSLSRGVHTIEARVQYSLGRKENLKLKIAVE
ncbi:MAG: M6 family metalloprotease domain-containing protein [Bacteroidales bacterium]|nr:M6 family metalloprotease domain-containing protein [Bacteroidales bacterium]